MRALPVLILVFTLLFAPSSFGAQMRLLVAATPAVLADEPDIQDLIRVAINANFDMSNIGHRNVVTPTSGATITFCTSSDPVDFLDCVETDLSGVRDSVSADVVIAVHHNLNVCGKINSQWMFIPFFSPSTIHDDIAYAAIKLACFNADQDVAGHEFGHLLSLEHPDFDIWPNTPVSMNHGHLLDPVRRTIMTVGSPGLGPWYSDPLKTYPSGGNRGHLVFANATLYTNVTTWDIVAAYRPKAPPSVMGDSEYAGCNGNTGLFLITWWKILNSTPVDTFVVERKSGLYWYPYFSGGSGCVGYSSDGQTNFRVKGINDAGSSAWAYFNAYHSCYGGGGGPVQ